uniref:GIY-YIG domain-containing protein n=1 Tax=Cacopsylla melanoneura TaxID=428564 RepID=A0A8D8LXS3_9HEMI
MGCSLSPIIADIVLDDLFDKILPQLNDSVQFCVKYVDDTFLSVDENKIDFVLNTFNSYHPEIQFTLEVENNCCLPFLDVSVIKNTNGSVDICHYKKPTCSGRLLNYNSNQPYSYKINCAKNLINRTLTLSDSKFHDNLIPEIYSTLIDNNYPKNLIKKLIQNRNSNSTHQNISNNLPPIYYSFPYLGETSYKVEKTMKTLVPSIKFGHKSYNPLKSNFFSNLKDSDKKDENSGIVYKLDCNDCNSSYIGESGQFLKKRMYQHKYDIKNEKTSTALSAHAFENNHNFNFDEVKIIRKEDHYKKRKTLEAFFINQTKNSINFKTDVGNTVCIYQNLLDSMQ